MHGLVEDKENFAPSAKVLTKERHSVLGESTVLNNSALEQTTASIQSLIKKMESGMEVCT